MNTDNYALAKNKILSNYKDSKITGSYLLDDGYLFALKPKNWKDDEYVLDGFFKVSKSMKITEYSPVMNTKEFKKALANRIE